MGIIGSEIKPFKATAFQLGKDFYDVTDAEVKGKWSVFFFYPADFTFVCPTELEDMADQYDELTKLGVEVYAVSTDTHFSHKAWHDSSPAIGKIKFPMLGDQLHTLAKNFGVLREEQGLADRGTFVVDPDGVIQVMEVTCEGVGRNAVELVRKIKAAQFARERDVPYFGICFGMQMAVIEAARNLVGIEKANSTEFGPCDAPVVGLMTEWLRGNELETRKTSGDLGGTMRLGAYRADLKPGSKIAQIYDATEISERHRHRYEVNTEYRKILEARGLVFSGMSPDGLLPETIEFADHPWFIGVQYHPELKSRPLEPHPLFASFIAAAMEQSRLV